MLDLEVSYEKYCYYHHIACYKHYSNSLIIAYLDMLINKYNMLCWNMKYIVKTVKRVGYTWRLRRRGTGRSLF